MVKQISKDATKVSEFFIGSLAAAVVCTGGALMIWLDVISMM